MGSVPHTSTNSYSIVMSNIIQEILKKYSEQIIEIRSLTERHPSFSPVPAICDPQLEKCLQAIGYDRLYSHQAEMFEKAIEGKNIIITTGTASGKSLAFYLPVIQKIIQNPSKRALFIFPTKALTKDQLRNIHPFVEYFGRKRLQAGVYDGDTPPTERKRIREEANIILTNPDMINSSFLPNHNRYGFPHLFANLQFVVIDELHAYRGAFGSHVSNVIRRLLRICKYHNNVPKFLCSSATIANPQELAENICHSKFVHVEKDGSPAPAKEIMFWQPPFVGSDKVYRRSVVEEIITLLPALIENSVRVISFCMTRRATEIVTKECRDILSTDKFSLGDKISGYRGGYTPEERRRIEKGLVNGDILGVVSTNALELGIDIGSLEMVVMGGFPGTRASFWQQAGRAGRRGEKAYAVLILNNRPIDQFIGMNPEWLIGRPTEDAVVDKDNLYIQLSHIRAAAAELPLTVDDIAYFPDLGEVLPLLQDIGEIKEVHNNYHWVGKSSPAHEFSLRNITNETVEVVDSKNEKTLTTVDLKQAKLELYPGAIYLHDTIQYKCLELSLETKIATVEPIDSNYYTAPDTSTNIDVLVVHNNRVVARANVFFGDVKVNTIIGGYKMIQFSSHQILGYEPLTYPLQYELDTEGCWIQLPHNVAKALYSGTVDPYYDYVYGLGHALKAAAEIKVMATFSDLGGGKFAFINEKEGTQSEAVILYDLYPGGLGFSEKAFENIEEIINNAILLVKKCRCKVGCPACVGNYKIDKKIILWALENLFVETDPPKDLMVSQEPIIGRVEHPFTWEKIEDDWPKLIDLMERQKNFGANLLSKATRLCVENASLILYFPESIVKLADKEEIKRAIINSLGQHLELPQGFTLLLESEAIADEGRKRSKLLRHFKDSKE